MLGGLGVEDAERAGILILGGAGEQPEHGGEVGGGEEHRGMGGGRGDLHMKAVLILILGQVQIVIAILYLNYRSNDSCRPPAAAYQRRHSPAIEPLLLGQQLRVYPATRKAV